MSPDSRRCRLRSCRVPGSSRLDARCQSSLVSSLTKYLCSKKLDFLFKTKTFDRNDGKVFFYRLYRWNKTPRPHPPPMTHCQGSRSRTGRVPCGGSLRARTRERWPCCRRDLSCHGPTHGGGRVWPWVAGRRTPAEFGPNETRGTLPDLFV